MNLTTLHRFHVAPGCDPSDPSTWVFEDRSADVNHTSSTAVSITGGRSDETGTVNPGSAILEVDNAGGHYCTRNPLGRWYGKLARNCPARWGVISAAEDWAATTSSSWGLPDVGTSWSLSGSAANWNAASSVGTWSVAVANAIGTAVLNGGDARDGEATFVASVPAVATGASLVTGVLARRAAGVNQIWFCIDFGLSGVLGVRIKRDVNGFTTDLGSGTAGTYAAGQRIKAKCVWDGEDLRMRVWPEAGTEPTTWTTVATDNQCQGAGVGMQFWRVSGNTNTSPVVFSADGLIIEDVEISGTIPAFPVRWDATATQSWAPLEIAGIGRRLSSGASPLKSPMFRQISSLTRLIGYWPMEDGANATQLTNIAGAGPGAAIGTQSGSQGPDGSASAITVSNADSTSRISGSFKSASTTAGWQICWALKLDALPTATTPMLTWYTSNGYTWQVNFKVGIYNIHVIDKDATVLLDQDVAFTGFDPPISWVQFRLKATVTAGTVSAEFAWNRQGLEFPWGTTGTFSGTVGSLSRWVVAGNASWQGGSLCHVFGVTTGTDNLQSYEAMRAFDGYAGEDAAARITRLCAEEGVEVAVEAGLGEQLGTQRIGTLLDLLRSAEAADMGVLYEAGSSLGYRPRSARYNRPVTLALSITGLDLGDPSPEPTDDDQRVSNDWTVSRDGGSDGTASDPEHIALSGRYPESTTINVFLDSRLDDHAGWRVHLGTWGEMRWPQVTLEMTDRSDLLTIWRGRPFGMRLTLSGVPAQGPIGDTVDLIVEGWTQDIGSEHWRVTLNCSPARMWDVGTYDAARYDSQTSTLVTGVNTTATSWSVTAAAFGDTWSSATPYDLLVTGERITLTNATAPAGTGPYTQTLTVTRSVNGIAKTHLAGESIRIATPGRYAL